ncbi:hypothetical protein [Pelagicoccus albus]|uniref:Uncharacterized protein n=1 Tax=Pelagicoccus albus TaxID=415222 RepID=A0A7X1B8F6_9BACT|nr:hypothetical protein [Pelagicoccus albus]MBC2607600.1 hypothetical protein [Pelagicoccus albus]
MSTLAKASGGEQNPGKKAPFDTSLRAARTFQQISSQYWGKKNRGSALSYLQSLSELEIKAVIRVHGFAMDLPLGRDGNN